MTRVKEFLQRSAIGLIAVAAVLAFSGCSDFYPGSFEGPGLFSEEGFLNRFIGESCLGITPGKTAEGGLDITQIEIPAYDGKPVAVINDNIPFFTEEELREEYFLELSELDSKGRCGSAVMCADEPHIQTGERGNISEIHPSGWQGGGFYQRSHLLMWKLSGCDDKRNLITGTATFNQESMLEYEERVTAYLWRNPENHCMYRVTPLFEGDNKLAGGVLMECRSVEDDGLVFCVFCYNAEYGAEIDYATGKYKEYNY